VTSVVAYLSYLTGVIQRRNVNPNGFHCDEFSQVLSASDICKSTGGEYLIVNFNLVRDNHGIGQSSMVARKPPQRDEEGLLLGRFEVVLRDALIREIV